MRAMAGSDVQQSTMQRSMVYSDTIKVIDILASAEKRQLSLTKLLAELNANETESLWDRERLVATLTYSHRKGVKYAGLALVQGGKAVRYSSGERSAINTGMYRDIREAMDTDGANIDRMFAGLHRRIYDVHNIGRHNGHWSRPDLLLELRTRPELSRPKELHSIELESAGGAIAANVAQAYVSGRGATKTWLIFSLRDYKSTREARTQDADWVGTEKLAKDLGVGLIGYRKLSAASTWRVVLEARPRSTDKDGLKKLRDLIAKAQEGM